IGMAMAQHYVHAYRPCRHGYAIHKCCIDNGYAKGFCQDGRFPPCWEPKR
ncbi:unnamed protein product, partial [Adineta steineri]